MMASDIAVYRDWLKANSGRTDVSAAQVDELLNKARARLDDPKFAHKRDYYQAEIDRLAAVKRIEEAE